MRSELVLELVIGMSWIRSFTSKNAFNQSSFYGWTVCVHISPSKSLLLFWSPESPLGRTTGRCEVRTCGVSRPGCGQCFIPGSVVDILSCFHHLTSESWTNSPSPATSSGLGHASHWASAISKTTSKTSSQTQTQLQKLFKNDEIWYVIHCNYCQLQWTECNDDILTMFPFFSLVCSAPGLRPRPRAAASVWTVITGGSGVSHFRHNSPFVDTNVRQCHRVCANTFHRQFQDGSTFSPK